MDIEYASEELLRAYSFPYASQKSMQFINLLVYAFGVFPQGVEYDLFFEVVPVDEYVLGGVCLPKENSDPVLQGELCSQAAA